MSGTCRRYNGTIMLTVLRQMPLGHFFFLVALQALPLEIGILRQGKSCMIFDIYFVTVLGFPCTFTDATALSKYFLSFPLFVRVCLYVCLFNFLLWRCCCCILYAIERVFFRCSLFVLFQSLVYCLKQYASLDLHNFFGGFRSLSKLSVMITSKYFFVNQRTAIFFFSICLLVASAFIFEM